jgi:hypothetical protein
MDAKVRELGELQEVLKARNEKLALAQQAEARLIKKQRELDDAKRELELTVETRVQDGLAEVCTVTFRAWPANRCKRSKAWSCVPWNSISIRIRDAVRRN